MIKKLLLSLIIFSSLVFPSTGFAQNELEPGGLIVCDGGSEDPCDFDDFLTLIEKLINVGLVLSTFLVIGLLVWTGFEYITSLGKPGMLSKAKTRFKNILIGYACIILAWVVVDTIMGILVKDNSYTSFINF